MQDERQKVPDGKAPEDKKPPEREPKPVGLLAKRYVQPDDGMTGGMRAALDRLGVA